MILRKVKSSISNWTTGERNYRQELTSDWTELQNQNNMVDADVATANSLLLSYRLINISVMNFEILNDIILF